MNVRIKKVSKVIVSLVLCLTMLMTLEAHTAQTKCKRGKFTITYKGKTVTMMTSKTDKKNSNIISTSNAKAVKKAWKKPIKIKKEHDNIFYTYKKGKSKISFCITKGSSQPLHGFDVSIKDKNFKLCGIQVGISKSQALKMLKKNFAPNAVETNKSSISLWFGPYMPVSYSLKNNKVVSISFWTS